MTRVLLTGGTGFLGSHLAEGLVGGGYEVLASVRASSDTSWIDPLQLETTLVDLGAADTAALETVLRGTDAIVHCGGLTRARTEDEFMAVNAVGTGRLAAAAAAAGVRRFVFMSSLAARGPDGAGGPISPYGRSKAEAERALLELADDLEVVIIRPGGVYGPRDSDLLPMFDMAKRGFVVVPRSPNPLQPVYVTDVVAATISSLHAPIPGAPLAIAHAALHPWSSLAEALTSAVGRGTRTIRVPPSLFWTAGLLSEAGSLVTRKAPAMDRRRARDMSVHRWTCDIEPTRDALDWTPRIDIVDGLGRTAEWYREQGWL
jgi:nucleoside-diphosphate-sugar epimerase